MEAWTSAMADGTTIYTSEFKRFTLINTSFKSDRQINPLINFISRLTDLGSVVPQKQSSLTFLPSNSTSSLRAKQTKKPIVKPRASTSISDFPQNTEIPTYFKTKKQSTLVPDKSSSPTITITGPSDSTNQSNELVPGREARSTANKPLNRFKVLRMLSSPSRPVALEQEILSRNFLIDNMTDYYNNFIKKDINYKDFLDSHENDDEDDEDEMTQESNLLDNESLENRKEDRFVNKLFRTRLKRSKSLEIKPNQTWVIQIPKSITIIFVSSYRVFNMVT